jgi:hypothetical protein
VNLNTDDLKREQQRREAWENSAGASTPSNSITPSQLEIAAGVRINQADPGGRSAQFVEFLEVFSRYSVDGSLLGPEIARK